MKKILFAAILPILSIVACTRESHDLKINALEYFSARGVNVLVYSNSFDGGFNDEKDSGIEIIHHGVRTVQGGAVRLNKTPEQWDLVPETVSRTVDPDGNSISRPNGDKARQYRGYRTYDDRPFLWGQNEGTIAGNCAYLIFGAAFRDMAARQ